MLTRPIIHQIMPFSLSKWEHGGSRRPRGKGEEGRGVGKIYSSVKTIKTNKQKGVNT